MTGSDLAAEHRAAVHATSENDLRALFAAGVSRQTIVAMQPARIRIAVTHMTYQPVGDGGSAFIVPVREIIR